MRTKEYDQREDEVKEQLANNIKKKLHQMNKNQDELADDIGFSPTDLSKSLNQTRDFTPGELEGIAKCLGITMDELFTGVPAGNIESHERTKLSTFAIDWLAETRERNDYLIEMVDIILDNKEIANSLFAMAYLYCVKVVPFRKPAKSGTMEDDLATVISDNDTLMKHAISDFVIEVFRKVKYHYDRNQFNHHKKASDKELYDFMQGLKKSMDEKQKEIDEEVLQENIDFAKEADEHNSSF